MISSIRYKSKSSILSQSSTFIPTFIPNKRFIFWIFTIKATLLAVLLILSINIKEGMLEELKHSTNDIRLSFRLRSGRRLSWLYSWWVSYRKFPNKIQCKRNKKYTNFNQVRDNIQKLRRCRWRKSQHCWWPNRAQNISPTALIESLSICLLSQESTSRVRKMLKKYILNGQKVLYWLQNYHSLCHRSQTIFLSLAARR